MGGPRTEYGTAHSHMGCPVGNGQLVVGTHAHAQTVNAVAAGNLRQQVKMRCGVFPRGRDAHEARHPQAMLLATTGNKGVGFHRRRTGLLFFLARIDLQKQIRIPALRRNFCRQDTRQPGPVHGMDGIKQRHRIARLVGLQRTDQMQLHVIIGLLQTRPFLLRLLHAVLSEHELTRLKNGRDGIRRKGLADGNEGNRGWRALRRNRRLINPGTDGFKSDMRLSCQVCAHE